MSLRKDNCLSSLHADGIVALDLDFKMQFGNRPLKGQTGTRTYKPKYICPKLFHNSPGLPYVKDSRLLSCANKSVDRIAQNAPVEESISSNRLNPTWDRFPMPLSVVRPVSLYINTIYWVDLPKRLSQSEIGSPTYTRTRLAQSLIRI